MMVLGICILYMVEFEATSFISGWNRGGRRLLQSKPQMYQGGHTHNNDLVIQMNETDQELVKSQQISRKWPLKEDRPSAAEAAALL